MNTISLLTKIENISTDARMQIASIYKTFNSNSITTKAPLSLGASGSATDSTILNLVDSTFIIIALDEKGVENEALDLELDGGVNTFDLTNLSFFMSGAFNLNQITITNNSDEELELYIIY